MIIAVSIVDKHKGDGTPGSSYVGTYSFEIDYPGGQHAGQIDLIAQDCPPDQEAQVRPMCGRLMTREEMRAFGPVVDGSGKEI